MNVIPLRILGPFQKQGGYYFRVVWPTHSRVIHGKSFKTVNRWSNILQRKIAEAKPR